VVFLSLCGLALAYKPPDTILRIATQTFTGLAVLFPAVVFGLYLKRVHPLPAILSILAGEALLVMFYLQWLPAGPFLPVVWILLGGFGVYLSAHWLLVRPATLAPGWLGDPYFWMLMALFALAMDFWAWGRIGPLVGGLPTWIGYFVLLSIGQTVLTYRWVRGGRSR
jgi:hypothetical protein